MSRWKILGGVVAALAVAGCGGSQSGPPASSVSATASASRGPVDLAAETAKAGEDVAAERGKLSPADRALVDSQEWCVVSTDERLGAMGPPVKLDIQGSPVFVCCKSCKRKAEANPERTLAMAAELKAKKATRQAR